MKNRVVFFSENRIIGIFRKYHTTIAELGGSSIVLMLS